MRWFFPGVSGGFLAALLIGFAPTFFLRSLFDVPPIPGYLYVHGVVLTTWFVLVFAQTCFVAAHRIDVHRRLGVATTIVAVLLVATSTLVTLRVVPRMVALGRDQAVIEGLVIGNLLGLVAFSGLVAAGWRFRNRPDIHKRLMTASCAVLFPPINARLARLGFELPPPVLILLPLLVIGVYDLITLKRLHRATMWFGFVFLLIMLTVFGLVIGSGAASRFIDALR
jgi:hypothetical protein